MNVTLVFAEGAHDIAFIGKLLCSCPDISRTNRSLSQLPSPLGAFFRKRIERLSLGDYRLDQSFGVGLPRLEAAFESATTNDVWLMLNCGGDSKSAEILELLAALQTALQSPLRSADSGSLDAITSVRTVHAYDADATTPQPRLARFAEAFSGFYGVGFTAPNTFFASSKCEGVMCLVIGGDPEHQTVEDLLVPFAKDQHAQFMAATDGLLAPVLAASKLGTSTSAKYKKAALTILGQLKYPGASLAAAIASGDHLHTTDQVKNCPRCTDVFNAITRRTSWA